MHVLLPTDVFPPGSVGGAAWSTHALAQALIRQGHSVTAVVPTSDGQRGSGATQHPDSGVPTVRWPYYAPPIPFVQNYYRHERLWSPLADVLVRLGQQTASEPLLIHAQHVQTTPAAVLAGRRLGVPVVATVRDHWPWDYFATGLHGNCLPCPPRRDIIGQAALLATDLPLRMGALRGSLALPAIAYMLAHVRRRATFLARADAVIAVSSYVARRLAPIVSAERLHVLPNMVDITQVDRIAATPPEISLPEPFLLYIGKLERNKGAALLVDVYRALRATGTVAQLPPLVIAGSGALRDSLERDLAALGVRVQFLAWVSHDALLRLLVRCRLLLFPSAWGEPLSRVLLEAAALGVPVLAMPTGGTPDIIRDGETGILARTPQQFARRMLWLLQHEQERRRLGAGARMAARQHFSVEAVLPQVEQLYAALHAKNKPK